MAAERSVVIFGAGAVGGYLGGRLGRVKEGPAITLIGRPPMLEAVRECGLVLRERDSESVTHPAVAVSGESALEGRDGAYDLVILTVRAYDVAASLPDVRALMGDSGLVLAMQNGVGSEEELAEALGRDRVLAGTLTVSAGIEEPGIVTRYSRGGGVAMSTMDGSAVPAWIVEMFRAAILPAEIVEDYRSLRWSKLLLNMLGAATTAILDVDVATMLRDRSLFRIEQLAFREAGRVMDAEGIRTVSLPGYSVPLARLAMRLPTTLARGLAGPRLVRSRGGRSPTMRADLARGRSEVGYLNGAVVRTARRIGIGAPVNAALTAVLEELVRGPERRAEFRGRADVLTRYMKKCGVGV